ncbi:MAG: tRNA pseudouridine(55) synthase TruB, partial [Spirochaetia bacterium]|nr:tRNA pseudouridine(55) synthase TruB [Spirochaetia bacterium]
MNEKISGFLLVNKPAGISTFDIIRIIKKKTGIKKLGHSGTLDPFAEGLVVILTGQMTRLFNIFSTFTKTYRAFAEFGKTSDTLDLTGTITEVAEIPELETIKNNLEYFTGIIKQTPPIYSAVHVNGVRAYELARKGITAELKEREVTVNSLEINSYEENILDFNINCSSGTYIRTLASDLAKKCGSAAYLKKLVRTDIGDFNLKESKPPDEITENDIITPEEGLKRCNIPVITADKILAEKILNGKKLPESSNIINNPDSGGGNL